MENTALLITALLGTTGIASLANYVALWGRKSRLRKSLKQMHDDIKLMDTSSNERKYCEHSLSVQSLELASLNLIKIKPIVPWLGGIFFAVLLIGFYSGLALDIFSEDWGWEEVTALVISTSWVTAMVIFSVIVIVALVGSQFYLSHKRHKFVADAWNLGDTSKEFIQKYSNYLEPSSHSSGGAASSDSTPTT